MEDSNQLDKLRVLDIVIKIKAYFWLMKFNYEKYDKNFWQSLFITDDINFYKELIENFDNDRVQESIINKLTKAYFEFPKAKRLKFLPVYNFLNNVNNILPEPPTKKWEFDRENFALFVLKKKKENGKSLSACLKELYPKYEFDPEWDWNIKKCSAYIRHMNSEQGKIEAEKRKRKQIKNNK